MQQLNEDSISFFIYIVHLRQLKERSHIKTTLKTQQLRRKTLTIRMKPHIFC